MEDEDEGERNNDGGVEGHPRKQRGWRELYIDKGIRVSLNLECTGVCGVSQQEAQRGQGLVGPEMVI